MQQQQFDYTYCFGAVCINTGQNEAIVSPRANSDAMKKYLELISKATPKGMMSVVILDRAGWHQKSLAREFNNLILMPLPPYSPELNPIEQVWSWLRQHCLANRCFDDYDDIVDSLCKAWNTFRQDTERVISMCLRKWAILNS